MTLARVLNRSTGLDLKVTDAIAVIGLAGSTAWDSGSPWPLAISALAFAWASRFPMQIGWLLWPALVCLAGALIGGFFWGPALGTGGALSRHALAIPALFGLTFIITIVLTRAVLALGDCDEKPLQAGRVRAGMWIALLLAAANLAQGSPDAAKGVALWAVLGGVGVSRIVHALRNLLAR